MPLAEGEVLKHAVRSWAHHAAEMAQGCTGGAFRAGPVTCLLSFISTTRTPPTLYVGPPCPHGLFGWRVPFLGDLFPCPTAKTPTLFSLYTWRSSPLLCKGQVQDRPPQPMHGEVKQKTFPGSCLDAETEWLLAPSLVQLKVTLDCKGGHAQDPLPGIKLTFLVHSQVFRLCYCTDTSDSNL